MNNLTTRRFVFFDLDGTLHQQNMFSCFLNYLIRHMPINILLIIPILPIVSIGLLIKGRSSRWPISLLLWSITFGHKETKLQALQARFIHRFRQRIIRFPIVQQQLERYIISPDVQVWLITGSPEQLVKEVYHDAVFLSKVQLIGSRIYRHYGGWILSTRCLGHEKVSQLKHKLGIPLKLYCGYSDSPQDRPLLYFCQYRWQVTHDGQLRQLD